MQFFFSAVKIHFLLKKCKYLALAKAHFALQSIFGEFKSALRFCSLTRHGRALEGSDPHELAGGFEVCQMKGTHIGAS